MPKKEVIKIRSISFPDEDNKNLWTIKIPNDVIEEEIIKCIVEQYYGK